MFRKVKPRMGRGDRRTKRGKIFAGSHGVTRPKIKTKPAKPATPPAKQA